MIVKSTNEIYEQKVKYREKLDSSGLVDYNGSLFDWTKKFAFIVSGKEYFIENAACCTGQSPAQSSQHLAWRQGLNRCSGRVGMEEIVPFSYFWSNPTIPPQFS